MVDRVIATPAAVDLLRSLRTEHGEQLMFHQSGGCCDNSAANCYLPTDLTIGPRDVKLGDVDGTPFYISKTQFETWKHTQLILDVIAGSGGTFSLESGSGKAFHCRARVFTPEEQAWLDAHPPQDCGL